MTATIQILSRVAIADPFTNLPAMWLPDHWYFPGGELAGVVGELPEGVHFDWTGVQASLAAQLKWAIATQCLRGYWRAQTLRAIRSTMKRIMGFLRVEGFEVRSLLDREMDTWLLQLRSYLIGNRTHRVETFPALIRSAPDGVKDYLREDVTIRFFRQLHAMVAEELDPRNEYDKDIWNLRRLGNAARGSKTINHLTFMRITQPWLKEALKRYCQYTLVRGAVSSCNEWILVVTRFSEYLAEIYPDLVPSELHRQVLLGFAPFLEGVGYSMNRRYSMLIHLRKMLEYCGREGLGGLPNRVLLYRQDLPARKASLPRFIPDEVVRASTNI